MSLKVAHLHLITLKPQCSNSTSTKTSSFIAKLLHSYFHDAQVSGPSSLHFKRNALIAHGRELVNSLEFFAQDLDEASKERVLEAGIKCLRAAGDSELNLNLSTLRGTQMVFWTGAHS